MKKNVLAIMFLAVFPYAYSAGDNGTGGESSNQSSRTQHSCLATKTDESVSNFAKAESSGGLRGCENKSLLEALAALGRLKIGF